MLEYILSKSPPLPSITNIEKSTVVAKDEVFGSLVGEGTHNKTSYENTTYVKKVPIYLADLK